MENLFQTPSTRMLRLNVGNQNMYDNETLAFLLRGQMKVTPALP